MFVSKSLITKRYHWIFDAGGVPHALTLKKTLVEKALRDIAKLCEMKIFIGPIVAEGVPENPGLTALCAVDFSHISIHTFSNPNEICVDIFSCKPYDPKKIQRYLIKAFRTAPKKSLYFEVKYPS